jgi:hypothetical protein
MSENINTYMRYEFVAPENDQNGRDSTYPASNNRANTSIDAEENLPNYGDYLYSQNSKNRSTEVSSSILDGQENIPTEDNDENTDENIIINPSLSNYKSLSHLKKLYPEYCFVKDSIREAKFELCDKLSPVCQIIPINYFVYFPKQYDFKG